MNANATSAPMPANSPFKPMAPHQAVATLLLIENSQAMSYIWPDLRDRYLQPLLSRFETNPAVPITTLVLESLPLQDERIPAGPRQYNVLQNGLNDFRFNCDPSNKLSVGKVSSGADILASTKFQGQPVARHLIIVAASTPVPDTTGVDLGSFIGRTPWYQLAQKFAQADIQCHMVVGPNEDMAPLMTLFEETLRLQNYVEESPSFPVDRTKLLFRLSAKPSHTVHPNAAPFPKRGLPPRRSHTYHGETYPRSPDEGTLAPPYNEPPTDPPPSLVSQLQQVHGLTKKKVYGTKPARMPFFRDERVRDKRAATLPQTTPALASPASITTLPTAGGRAVSRSRAERIIRVAGGSPTEPHPRRQHGSRRGSRLSSPESENLALPAYGLHPSLSQVPPMTNTDGYLGAGHHDGTQMYGEVNVVSEPTWLQPHYPPVIPSISQTQFSPAFMGSQMSQTTYAEPRWQPEGVSAGVVYSQQMGQLEGSTMASHAPLPLPRTPHHDVGGSLQSNSRTHENVARPPRNSRVSAPGDEIPFTFDAEYVAATTALFNSEVLPAYPNFAAMSEPARPMKNLDPPRSFYLNSDYDSLPPSPSSPAYNSRELYGPVTHHVDDILHPSLAFDYPLDSPLSYATSYSPGSSSSLTGWAG
ncbi:hypothetical protein BDZ94DRAFT_968722 [Collybia nuda]|uniref:Uncharacterized protein n=1 Tax=Collybia nuda TaxID=64659 RepID=A0A9P5YEU8_9AGAR|nr:hypothetical protein BDZ94DRAFT_968722 [Collybia nuda]